MFVLSVTGENRSSEKEKHITSKSKTRKQQGAEGIRDRGPSRRADTCSVVANHHAPRELHCESLGPFLGRSIALLFSASIFLGQCFCHPVIFVIPVISVIPSSPSSLSSRHHRHGRHPVILVVPVIPVIPTIPVTRSSPSFPSSPSPLSSPPSPPQRLPALVIMWFHFKNTNHA